MNNNCIFSPYSPSAEKDESFVGGSQKLSMPPPARSSPEIPLLGVQSGKAITPLDVGRFQSKVFHSVMNQMQPKVDISTPDQKQDGCKKKHLQKEASLQLDTPSRFLSRDQLFRPCFNLKVATNRVLMGFFCGRITSDPVYIQTVCFCSTGCTW